MQKKLMITGAIIIAIILIVVVFVINYDKKDQNQEEVIIDETLNIEEEEKQEIQKMVEFSDGKTNISFSIPNKWVVETRHSGEKEISVEEMRNFLVDNVDPYSLEFLSQYSDESIEEQFYGKGEYPKDFPTASISSNKISYSDVSWYQIDFTFVSENVKKVILEENYATEVYETSVGENIAYMETFPLDSNGESSKDGTGGIKYYIKIAENKTLIISKQAKGNEQFEKDFDYLIKTFKIKK
ncbi:MAG: hypothetical protein KAT32_02535 [Candidatus Moranbacteria bacterium]|nr:hypothetical protein [Candidatus Moranbacteria bacterium]